MNVTASNGMPLIRVLLEDPKAEEYGDIPCYMILDKTLEQQYRIVTRAARYDINARVSYYIEKLTYLIEMAEAARKIGVNKINYG